MFILTSVIQCACAVFACHLYENVAASLKFCSSSRTYQFLLPNVFIPVQKPTGQTYIMLISSVKAVPNHRAKKHNLKKGQMKKDKVFPPVKHINNVWTNKQQRQNRERALQWGFCLAMGCIYECSGFNFRKPASSSGRWQRNSLECHSESVICQTWRQWGSAQFCFSSPAQSSLSPWQQRH